MDQLRNQIVGIKTRLIQILNDFEHGHKMNFSKKIDCSTGNTDAWFDFRNPVVPNNKALCKIAMAYNVDLNWLLLGHTEVTVEPQEVSETTGLPLTLRNGVSLVDSRVIAEALGIEHRALIQTIKNHQAAIESRFGAITFEMLSRNDGNLGGKQPKHALLTEDQAYFVGTLSKNNKRVLDFKGDLIIAFSNARKGLSGTEKSSPATFIIPQTFSEALRVLASQVEAREASEGKLDSIRKILEIN